MFTNRWKSQVHLAMQEMNKQGHHLWDLLIEGLVYKLVKIPGSFSYASDEQTRTSLLGLVNWGSCWQIGKHPRFIFLGKWWTNKDITYASSFNIESLVCKLVKIQGSFSQASDEQTRISLMSLVGIRSGLVQIIYDIIN